MPRRTKHRTNRRLKKGGLFANLGPFATKIPKMDQRGRHEMMKRNRAMVESSEDIRGCAITSWGSRRKKKSCVSDKWKQRGCYWATFDNDCYDVNEKFNARFWEALKQDYIIDDGLTPKQAKEKIRDAKKEVKESKRKYRELKGLPDYLTSESLKSSSRSSSKRSSRSSSRSSSKRSSRSSSRSSSKRSSRSSRRSSKRSSRR